MAETIATAYVQITPSMAGVKGEIEKGLGGAGKSAGSTFGSTFKTAAGVAMGNLAAGAIQATAKAATDFAKDAVNTGKEFDEAMAQVAATSGKTMSELEAEVGKVSTAYGDFEGNLRDFALFMGGNTAFSTKEAAEALNYMALAGYDAQTSMNMLPNVLNLAAAGAMDLASASDMVTDVSSALNLNLDETAKMVDEMAKAAASSNTSVAQLGDAMLKIGGTAANMKGGTQELATALGILANNGIKSAEGGTHLRNMMLSITNIKTDAAVGAMKQLGLSTKFAYDEMGNLRGMDEIFVDLANAMDGMSNSEIDSILTAVFNKTDLSAVRAMLAGVGTSFNDLNGALEKSGVEWDKYKDRAWAAQEGIEAGMADLASQIAFNISQGLSDVEIADFINTEYDINNMEDTMKMIEAARSAVNDEASAWDDLYNKIGDADGAAQKMADTQLDNLAGDMTKFDSALSLAYQAVADKLTPALREVVQFGTEGISQLTTAFNEGGLDGLMSALGDIVSQAASKLVTALPDVANAGMELISALGQGLMDNLPLLLSTSIQIVADIANRIAADAPAMIPAAVSLILELTDTLLDNMDMLIDASSALMIGVVDGLIAALPILLDNAPVFIEKFADALVVSMPKIIDLIIQLTEAIASALIDNLPVLLQAIGEMGIAVVNGYLKIFAGIFGMIMGPAEETGTEAAGSMVDFFMESVNAKFAEWGASISSFFEPIIAGVVDFFTVWGAIFTDGFNAIAAFASDAIDTITQPIIDGWNAFMDFISPLTNALAYLFETMWTAVQVLTERAVDAISAWLTEKWTAIRDFIEPIITGIHDKFVEIWDGIKMKTEEIFNGVKTFIEDTWNSIVEFWSPILDSISAKVSEVWENISTSVSTWMTEVYNNLSTAWTNITTLISDTLGGIWDSISGFFGGLIDDALKWGSDLIDSFVSGIKDNIDKVADTITGMADAIRDVVGFSEPKKGPLSDFHTFAPDMMRLFAQGIQNNENMVMAQIRSSFDFGDQIKAQNDIVVDTAMTSPAYAPTAVAMPVETQSNDELSGQFAQAVSLLDMLVKKDPVEIGANADGIFDLIRHKNTMYVRANGRGAFA